MLMRSLLAFLPLLALASCMQTSKPKPPKPPAVVVFVDTFYRSRPMDNDVLRDRADSAFARAWEGHLRRGITDSLPMELRGVKEYEQGMYAAHFSWWQGGMALDMIGWVDAGQVASLKEKQRYRVQGRFVEFREGGRPYSSHPVYSDEIRVSDRGNVLLGVVFMGPLTIQPVE